MKPRLDVVIVNWNAGDQLRACLESLTKVSATQIELCRVVVVDNASSDRSADNLAGLSLPLALIRNSKNRGFAAACNQGANGTSADYVLFLNPDTQLFKDSFEIPIAFMEQEENGSVGICGIQLVNAVKEVSRTCARFPTLPQFLYRLIGIDVLVPGVFRPHFMIEWPHLESRQVDHVMGAFFLVRGELFEKLGGFDERFFVYFEDVDFSLRASRAGFLSYYLAEAQAFHKGCGTSDQIRATRLFYSHRSRLLYGFKHFNLFSALALLVCTAVIEPFPRLVRAAFRCSKSEVIETLSAHWRLLRALPAIIRRSCKP